MTEKHYNELKKACEASRKMGGTGFSVDPLCYELLRFATPVFKAIEDFRKLKPTYGNLLAIKKLQQKADKIPESVEAFLEFRTKLRLIRFRKQRTK